MRKSAALCLMILISVLLSGVGSYHICTADEIFYLKNNIHAQKGSRDIKASYANWTNPGQDHMIIPVNSKIKIESWRKGFIIRTIEGNKKIYFEFHKGRMGMSVDEYISLITSSDPDPVALERYSKIDRKGIEEGKVYKGMSKNGVRAALGYPATHRTPSLDDNTWIYWTNRFKTIAVEFDSEGRVTEIRS